MKKFLYSAALAMGFTAMAAGFTSCSDDGYTEGPASEGAYFAPDVASRLNFFYEDTQAEIKMVRTNSDAEQTFAIEMTDTTGFFTCPQSVTFPAGQKEASIVLTFDPTKFEPKDYGINLHVVDGYLYGLIDYSPIVGLDESLRWADMEGMATFTEDIVGPTFGRGVNTYNVPVQKKIGVKDVYRLVNPYGEWFPLNEPGDYDAANNYYMVINASNPEQVYVEECLTGTDWGYGAMEILWIGDLTDQITAADFGTFEDGVIKMPASTLYLYMGGKGYYGKNTDEFKIVLPGAKSDKE